MPWLTTVSASATSGATAIGVTADIFRVNDVVRITETGEAILVTATGTGAITATRGLGSGASSAAGAVAAASCTSAAELFIVANSNAEGATLREIKYPQLSNPYNYAEIFRTPFGVTGTEDATTHYGGPERARLRAKFGKEHLRNIERAAWAGARDIKNTNQRTTGGVFEFLSTNTTNQAGTLSEAQWLTFLRKAFRYGSERKVFFASPLMKAVLDQFPSTTAQNPPGDTKTWGVDMQTYVSGQGIVDIVMKRDWNDSTVYSGYGVMIDPANVEYHYLRDTMLLPNRQAPDYDGYKDEYLSECGFKIAQEATHAILKGVTGKG